jgi:hypothetical protein
MYRQRAADAKDRATQAKNSSIKSAFEEVANVGLLLAEQVEWIDRHRSPVRDEGKYANRHTQGTFGEYKAHCGARSGLGVMAQKSACSYRVSRNGPGGDWYWEVMCDRKIIDRGVAPTRAEARAQALKVARSYLVQENSMPSFEGLKAIVEP